jgi:hypothetical protein
VVLSVLPGIGDAVLGVFGVVPIIQILNYP